MLCALSFPPCVCVCVVINVHVIINTGGGREEEEEGEGKVEVLVEFGANSPLPVLEALGVMRWTGPHFSHVRHANYLSPL